MPINPFYHLEHLLHWSDIIGATHSREYSGMIFEEGLISSDLSSIVWNYGDIASDGLKQVAEWGAIGTMQKEIKNHVNSCVFDFCNH